jgi:hypothetical protein
MSIDLRQLYFGRQRQLASQLGMARQVIAHPGDKGAVSENEWLELLRSFLPERYRAAKATVIDSTGSTSDSIDIVVYDRQYSPMVFEQAGFLYVAAEAVYAVFEVKQSLNAEHVDYAAKKAASVRRLMRTSAPVVDIRGETPRKEPIKILAGLLTTDIEWSDSTVEAQLRKHLEPLDSAHELDLLCAADSFAFDAFRDSAGLQLAASARNAGLVFFLFGVLQRLQRLGTVAPIDFGAYRGAM